MEVPEVMRCVLLSVCVKVRDSGFAWRCWMCVEMAEVPEVKRFVLLRVREGA